MVSAAGDAFTPEQRAFLQEARSISRIAIDRDEPLYRFLRYATASDRQTVHDALVLRQFRFGRPRDFNDPFDCRPHLRLPGRRWFEQETLRLVREKFPGNAAAEQQAREDLKKFRPEEHVAATEQRIREQLLDRQQMLCLCGNQRHVLMWAYYADRHRGVALHLSSQVWPIAAAKNVTYTNRYPAVSLASADDLHEIARQFALKKARAWRHEDEYRVLVLDDDPARFAVQWASPSVAIFPAGAVTGVTVGSLMDDAAVQQVVASARAATPAVPVFQAKAQRKRFMLDFDRIA